MISHPLQKIQKSTKRFLFLGSFLLTLLLMAGLQVSGSYLISNEAPRGIISFELAGTVEQAELILTSWDMEMRQHAAFSLGLDFLYLFAYAIAISLACVILAERNVARYPLFSAMGFIMAWLILLAGLLDAIENTALIIVLNEGPAQPLVAVAAGCAYVKFVIVIISLIWLLLAYPLSLTIKYYKGKSM